jgi:hypothetical protein
MQTISSDISVQAESPYVFTMTPSLEMLTECESKHQLLIVFVHGKDFSSGEEFMANFGLVPSSYLHAYVIPDDETFETAQARILKALDDAAKENPMWFAPAGTTRGTLAEAPKVLYEQSDADIEQDESVCPKVRIVCDESNNSEQDIEENKLNVDVYINPPLNATEIPIKEVYVGGDKGEEPWK